VVLECKQLGPHLRLSGGLSIIRSTRNGTTPLEHCEICSATLDSTRNILILTADDRVFELPISFSNRLHTRLAEEINAASHSPQKDEKD
jgi:hypothetical protein